MPNVVPGARTTMDFHRSTHSSGKVSSQIDEIERSGELNTTSQGDCAARSILRARWKNSAKQVLASVAA